MKDLRDELFSGLDMDFSARLLADRGGCLSGVGEAEKEMQMIGARVEFLRGEGEPVRAGEVIATVSAGPKTMTLVEERLMGKLSKYSGVATAARRAVELAGGRARVVSGSWKKMPPEIKDGIRAAVVAGGASFRISTQPMLYMDKNYIRMLGSIEKALDAADRFPDLAKVIQVRGLTDSIEAETRLAVERGCAILMVDTGNPEDLGRCTEEVKRLGRRNKIEIAYSGNVGLGDIEPLIEQYGLDVLCIGKAIVDAPMMDMKLDVTGPVARGEGAAYGAESA